MRRREFIRFLGAVPMACPLASLAQQSAMRTIGLLSGGSAEAFGPLGVAFRAGLESNGFVEGNNVLLETRWANGQFDRLPALAADLIGRGPSVIVTVTLPAALAAKEATGRIPVVFVIGDDPIEAGLVPGPGRPGNNVTGVTNVATALGRERLAVLSEALPKAKALAFLVNWDNPNSQREAREFQSAARALGRRLQVITARTDSAIEAAFATAAEQKTDALFVSFDPVFFARREQIIALAAHHGVPTVYPLREFVVAGGLMSYGASFLDGWRQAGLYVARILNGEKPADLPVQGPSKFELVINIRTAKTAGLDLPPGLIARADEVIQ
jgi:putative tryptophan/tyrosine transport system substrate-binding protein